MLRWGIAQIWVLTESRTALCSACSGLVLVPAWKQIRQKEHELTFLRELTKTWRDMCIRLFTSHRLNLLAFTRRAQREGRAGPDGAETYLSEFYFMRQLLVPQLAVTLGLASLLSGCSLIPHKQTPSIEFTKVPVAGPGGPDKLDVISGRVLNALPGQQLVLYAKSELWWVQPTQIQPFSKIQDDGTWSNNTHLGTDYAVLLVDANYNPAPTMYLLPKLGGGVIAIAQTKGSGASPAQDHSPYTGTVNFSGYEWKIRSAANEHGGKSHSYDPVNVSLDEKGFLHMKVTKRAGEWVCSEIALGHSLGYGTYAFKLADVSHFEPAADLEMFTWSDAAGNAQHNEMDIDITRRGDPESKNAEYVVQPYYLPANVHRFAVLQGAMMYSFDWEPDRVAFTARRKTPPSKTGLPNSDFVFKSGVPRPADETAHINFCAYPFSKVPLQREAEVIIENFQYLP